MFDFIKSNKKLFGILSLGVFIIVIIIGIFITVLSRVEVEQGGDVVLPDTSGERDFDVSAPVIFGPTDSEHWIPSDASRGDDAPVFRAITKDPVAGAVVFERFNDGSVLPSVRYVTLGNGNIYESSVAVVDTPQKISDKVVSNIGDVVWGSPATEVLIRNLNSQLNLRTATLGMFLRGSTTENTKEYATAELIYEHRQLENNIRDAAFSPNGTRLFYLVESPKGTVGYLESVKTGARAVVWNSVFRSVSVSWNSDKIVLYTNPSSETVGAVWILNPTTGTSNILLADELALSAKLNDTGDKLLYSIQEEKSSLFSLRMYDLKTGNTRVLPLSTFVEKCSWGDVETNNIFCAVPQTKVSGDFLEKWYMGKGHTNDEIWRVNVMNGNTQMLFNPNEEVGEDFDIVDVLVTKEEGYLVFRTRVNNALWSLQLPQKISTSSAEEVVEEGE